VQNPNKAGCIEKLMTVTMYTTTWCPYCVRAKNLLSKKGVTVSEVNIEEVDGARDEMVQKTGRMTVPQIYIGETHVGGCDELYALESQGKLDALLA
jgi:glutaredoxin 3